MEEEEEGGNVSIIPLLFPPVGFIPSFALMDISETNMSPCYYAHGIITAQLFRLV
jgi:hypothetical protein